MEPFDIQINIEGMPERLTICPQVETGKFKVYDGQDYIGMVYQDTDQQGRDVWCAEGMIARELKDEIVTQLDPEYKAPEF